MNTVPIVAETSITTATADTLRMMLIWSYTG